MSTGKLGIYVYWNFSVACAIIARGTTRGTMDKAKRVSRIG